mgnify:CR=1 FL=1
MMVQPGQVVMLNGQPMKMVMVPQHQVHAGGAKRGRDGGEYGGDDRGGYRPRMGEAPQMQMAQQMQMAPPPPQMQMMMVAPQQVQQMPMPMTHPMAHQMVTAPQMVTAQQPRYYQVPARQPPRPPGPRPQGGWQPRQYN